MTQQHPTTPPPELVHQWRSEWIYNTPGDLDELGFLANCAAQWGADCELEACCKWLPKLPPWSGDDLRRHRRPKPPSLKEQALQVLEDVKLDSAHYNILLRALEQLPDNE
jgi:hypothetical protein